MVSFNNIYFYLFCSGKKKYCIVKWDDVDKDITYLSSDDWTRVLEYLSPRDLLHLSVVNKSIRGVISNDLRVIILVGMLNGGRSMKSLENLYYLMNTRSIYIPNPLRILRIINGRSCEFCVEKGCHYLRPQFGVYSCWDCLRERQNNSLGISCEQLGPLSARWHKVVYLKGRGFFLKQYHIAHRYVLYDIFEHMSVLCHPTGLRWMRKKADVYIPTTKRNSLNIASQDAHEIMWMKLKRDQCGDLIGPFFVKSDVNKAVQYITGAEGQLRTLYNPSTEAGGQIQNIVTRKQLLECFFTEQIDQYPNPSDYKSFIQKYDLINEMAQRKKIQKES